jgi:hypothetical protein
MLCYVVNRLIGAYDSLFIHIVHGLIYHMKDISILEAYTQMDEQI